MSQPTPTVFYLVVFREDQPGPQHKVLTSISGLARFQEMCQEEKTRGFDCGPFDVFLINTEMLEVAPYDLAPLRAFLKQPKRRRS